MIALLSLTRYKNFNNFFFLQVLLKVNVTALRADSPAHDWSEYQHNDELSKKVLVVQILG